VIDCCGVHGGVQSYQTLTGERALGIMEAVGLDLISWTDRVLTKSSRRRRGAQRGTIALLTIRIDGSRRVPVDTLEASVSSLLYEEGAMPRLRDGVIKRAGSWSYVIRVRDPSSGVSKALADAPQVDQLLTGNPAARSKRPPDRGA
jgi:hypothetical protein